MSRLRKPPADPNQAAALLVNKATEEATESPSITIRTYMKMIGSRGGKKGGRWKNMTAEQKSMAATKAAQARWAKQNH